MLIAGVSCPAFTVTEAALLTIPLGAVAGAVGAVTGWHGAVELDVPVEALLPPQAVRPRATIRVAAMETRFTGNSKR
jgi:hypothetical protein